ncbi:response regulator [Paenibacillus macerans]|uniref:Helix-turn-helix domain protein n=1 Tax=Paenibacillus macerans TaxID=44252 RepID=A0A090ZA34_PAEMA|nr:response regulator [Paenibacillus macerans]KFN07273.1 helix-turn-helix domain protein [Paenibacillus macerans]MCY7558258.1 response regulator [Paenibacillus macerans]MEC0140275.1 response regulator [Paenibacillus macerans]MEC0155181.1 response regulator [Paenibacillus macerans]MEC0334028.1 response regulator [Paenibacillus macerans]
MEAKLDKAEKYRVILVDDEPVILRSLKVAVPWEELNLEIVGEARNGEKALQLVRELSPHMIISDIRMPGIDGIALMKKVLAENPKRLFIFISGYGEFEYAREALREGAFDYLLKPIDHDELIEMIQRAKKNLEKQMENDKLLHSVQVLSVLARERLFAEFIEGNQGQSPIQHMRWLENSELAQEYFMAVIQLDHYMKLNEQWTPEERRLWLFAIRNILGEWSMANGALTVFPFHGGEWVLLFPGSLSAKKEELGGDVIRQIKMNTKLSCSIGFSQLAAGMEQLSEAYQSAAKALYRRFYSDREGVFLDSGSGSGLEAVREAKYPKHLEAALLESIRTLDRERLLGTFDETKRYIEDQAFTKEMAERMIVELTVVLYRQFEHLNLSMEWPLEGLLQELHSLGALHEMIGLLKSNFGKWITDSRENPSKENVQNVIGKTQEYILGNYHKDLSIDEVAELAGLSISHFCLLFKQVSGYTFLEYLTQCRIEKAKFILKNSHVKVYQVAPMVGYQDPRYFTQVFKKVTGMTPTEFREAGA